MPMLFSPLQAPARVSRWASAPLAAACCWALTLSTAQAQEAEGPQPVWEVGALGLMAAQQAYPGADESVQRTLVLPYVLYRGRYLRADRETAGLRALRTPTFELDIGFAGAFGSRSSEVKARSGMDDIGFLIEFGPRIKWNLHQDDQGGRWRMDLPLRGVFDVSDQGAHRGMSFEPEVRYSWPAQAGWRASASVSAIVADRRLARTFYEVSPAQVRADRPAYQAQAGLVAWRLSGALSRQLTPDWRLFTFARLDSVAGAANRDSPLVRRTTGWTAGVGASWTWLRSGNVAED